MIKQAFDHPNNTDYDSYKRKSGFGGVIFAGDYKELRWEEIFIPLIRALTLLFATAGTRMVMCK